MSLHRVVPVDNEEITTRTEVQVDWDETEIRGEEQVADILLVEAKGVFYPAMDLDSVGRLVASLDEATLQLLGKAWSIDKRLSAGA